MFVELMKSATSSVEFSFNNTMCKQTDGVVMGLPCDPALANIFVGYCNGFVEQRLLGVVSEPETDCCEAVQQNR